MAIYMAVTYRLTAGRIPVGRPECRQWGDLQRSATWLMAVTGLTALQTTGAGLVISLMHDPKTTGYFYWGFTVSGQIVFLLATNLQQVMMAVLARLNAESERQAIAATKAIQTLTVIVTPVCLLQVLLAEPVIRFIFHDRWLPSVSVVQFISVGMATQPLNLLAGSLLIARGKFRRLAGATAVMVAVLLAAAALGSVLGRQREIAMCVMAGTLIGNLYAGWLVFREFERGWAELFAAMLPALKLAVPLSVVTWSACHFSSALNPLLMAAVTVATCAVACGVFLRWLYPGILNEVVARFARRSPETSAPHLQP
jgi:PST family polysaccharide transporter